MIQSELWHDTVFDALGTAIQAAGGIKRVAAALWPAVDPASAASRLRGALSPEHAQKIDPAELSMIGKLAREAGDMSLPQFFAREWHCELKALAPAEAKKRARKARISALLSEVAKLSQEDE